MSENDRDSRLGTILKTMHREGDGVAQMALYRISDLDSLMELVEPGNEACADAGPDRERVAAARGRP